MQLDKKIIFDKPSLSKGNRAFRDNNFKSAMALYLEAQKESPSLMPFIRDNIQRTRNKHLEDRLSSKKLNIAVCGWELSHNAAGRAYTLAKLYKNFANVDIIGTHFPHWGRKIWEPIRKSSIPIHSFVVDNEAQFIEHTIDFIAEHPYDIVHLSKPRISNILFGVLYNLIWGARILIDIDDEELAFVGEKNSINIDEYIDQYGKLPDLKDLPGKDWTRIAVGLAKSFEYITVSNPVLKKCYGGEIIRHARNEELFLITSELKIKSREEFNIPQGKKVLLFFGTPVEHKGLIETAKAISELKRKDILFLIVGDFKKFQKNLQNKLNQIPGVEIRFIGNQPINRLPEIIALGDFTVLLQDEKSSASKYQIPAKLSDAMAGGLVVLTNRTPPLLDVIENGGAIPVNKENLSHRIEDIINGKIDVESALGVSHQLFIDEFSFSANIPRLKTVIQKINSDSTCQLLFQKLRPLLSEYLVHLPGPPTNFYSSFENKINMKKYSSSKIAILVHIFYLDLWDIIAGFLKKITHPFDLFITTTTEISDSVITEVKRNFPSANIIISENIGMDIIPFLKHIPFFEKEGYLAVCKLHTKKGAGNLGVYWQQLMLECLVGNDQTVSTIVHAFNCESNLSLVGPSCFFQSAKRLMYDNGKEVEHLKIKLDNQAKKIDDWGFFAGTSFWVKPSSLLHLSEIVDSLNIKADDDYKKDGNLVHAIERIFGLVPLLNNEKIGLIHYAVNEELENRLLTHWDTSHHIAKSHVGQVLKQAQRLQNDSLLIKNSKLFNIPYYLSQQPEIAGHNIDLIAHYLLIGRFKSLSPHPDFDPTFYSKKYSNIIYDDKDPFVHYLCEGALTDLPLRKKIETQKIKISNFRYQVLNSTIIDWNTIANKYRKKDTVSIIILVYNQLELTRQCIESLYINIPIHSFELIIVDNGSEKEVYSSLLSYKLKHKNIQLIRNNENLNFAMGNNLGFSISNGSKIIFLNNDTIVTKNWLNPLLKNLDRSEISAVQPCLLFPNGYIQCIGVVFSDKSPLGYPIYAGMRPAENWRGRSRFFQAVTGACMALRAEDFISVRGFDPVYINGQEDVDLCLRINTASGRKCWYEANSIVYHKQSQSKGRFAFILNNRKNFIKRWKNRVVADDFEHYTKDNFFIDDYKADTYQNNNSFFDLSVYTPVLKPKVNG